RARAVLDTAGPRLEKTLDQMGQAAERLNEIGSALDSQAQALKPLLLSASKLGHSIDRTATWMGTAMTLGGAVGPAIIAGVRALFSRADNDTGHGGHNGNGPDAQHPPSTAQGDTR
ncbi:MAG TPA: hypothetical protein VFG76_11450, partial [Candidatus Polarisedimenticolia bacterium]|nr:hypothetical protein [Candidatus Polarisedimenticolia bacterium]